MNAIKQIADGMRLQEPCAQDPDRRASWGSGWMLGQIESGGPNLLLIAKQDSWLRQPMLSLRWDTVPRA